MPIVYLTAFYALRDLADVRSGQRILIHAAAGGGGDSRGAVGPGLGGCRCTPPPAPGKWDTLRGNGLWTIRHLASSRDLDFRHSFLAATGGQGVDVCAQRSDRGDSWTRRWTCCPVVAGSWRWVRPDVRDHGAGCRGSPRGWRIRRSTCPTSVLTGSGRCWARSWPCSPRTSCSPCR